VYNVTLRRVPATIVAVVKQYVLHILSVCLVSYAACNARGTYCHLWAAPLYTIFPHYLINGTIKKKILNTNRTGFPLQLLSETFLFPRWTERGMIKMSSGIHLKYPLFLPDFIETWPYATVFRKILKYKISGKFVQWEPSYSMWTDGRTYTTMLIVAFHNSANAPKNLRPSRNTIGI